MADQQPGIFRQEAVEQASSVEQLDQLMQVIDLKDWLPLVSIGALLAAALIWSVVARIPTYVQAKGLLLSDAAHPNQLMNVSYFPIGDGKQVHPGDRILLVPDTVNIQEFGGLEARVVEVSSAPVTEQSALKRVNGNRELLNLVYIPASIEVVAQLKPDPNAPSGYQWSMSQGPKMQLTSEIPTTSKVMLSERAPISYVFPFLK
jgi:HlyD family secretion protein